MASESSGDRLPFEPRQKKKKPLKQPPLPRQTKNQVKEKPSKGFIPDAVSKRMAKRMAAFSGIPTGLGMSSFFVFYWIVSNDWLEIPSYVVLAVSLGLFGLGVLGLSYGIFSASWDENRAGDWWGWEEFKINVGRTIKAWRDSQQAAKEAKKE